MQDAAVDGCFVAAMIFLVCVVSACCNRLPWHTQHVPAWESRMTEGVGERPSTTCMYLRTSIAHNQPGVLQYDGIVDFASLSVALLSFPLSFCFLSPIQCWTGQGQEGGTRVMKQLRLCKRRCPLFAIHHQHQQHQHQQKRSLQ